MSFTNTLYLPSIGVNISWSISRPTGPNEIKTLRRLLVTSKDFDFSLYIDERFNTIGCDSIIDDSMEHVAKIELVKKFNELYQSDIRYRRGDGYEGDLSITLEKFIEYLKIEERNYKLNNILK